MTITTGGTAVHLAPTVTKTFFKHYYKKAKRSFKKDTNRKMQATDELMFDEAFQIVRNFISLGTNDTVEAIQKFTDANPPPIPWATTLQVTVPIESCDRAAKIIIDHLGPQDLTKLVGGEKWWQMRTLPGVQGEWIAMSSDWKKMKAMEKEKRADHASTSRAERKKRRRDKRHERTPSQIKRMSKPSDSDSNAPIPGNGSAVEVSEDTDTDAAHPLVLTPVEDVKAEEETSGGPAEDANEELDRLQRVMLYFHGGGYYFGSLATHRYQIVRYARKFGGKCFAPVYRKAPQYPWPCALQDAVASYLYLIDPPADAKHSAIDPKKIVVAGDSAGGGLSLALLTVIRDMGLPAPAGAVLISPWCDLTHSFPSILQNTDTDIIPPYGFIHKPSTLWPVNATRPDKVKGGEDDNEPERKVPVGIQDDVTNTHKKEQHTEVVARKSLEDPRSEADTHRQESRARVQGAEDKSAGIPPPLDLLWSDPLKINTTQADKQDIELREQIQLYATNDQLMHPLCSAVLSGSLGGLPPLFILAGDAEVLRDEIVYLAHRAAHPDKYPLRHDLLDHSERSRGNAEKYDSQPTKVHLQVYDQMCHVLTAFAFTSQSRFAYRAVASFVKHVTGAPTNYVKNPFPEVVEGEYGPENDQDLDEDDAEVASLPTESLSSSRGSGMQLGSSLAQSLSLTSSNARAPAPGPSKLQTATSNLISSSEACKLESPTTMESPKGPSESLDTESQSLARGSTAIPATSGAKARRSAKSKTGNTLGTSGNKSRSNTADFKNEYAGQVPLTRPSFHSFMIRERVDVEGFLRPLEPETELQALQVSPDDVGLIKEGPVARYLDGKGQWSKRYEKTAHKVEKKRAKNEALARKILEEAAAQGLLDVEQLKKRSFEPFNVTSEQDTDTNPGFDGSKAHASVVGSPAEETARKHREQWGWLADVGPMDLLEETPPPAAIAGRRDTEDALALIRHSLQIRAKCYGLNPKSRLRDDDNINDSSPVAEQSANADSSRHGLRIWNLLMTRGRPVGKSVPSKESQKGRTSRPQSPKSPVHKAFPVQTRKSAFDNSKRSSSAAGRKSASVAIDTGAAEPEASLLQPAT